MAPVPVDRSERMKRLFHGTRVVVHYSYGAHGDDGAGGSLIRNVTGRVESIDAVTSAVIRPPIDAIGDSVEIAEGQATRHPLNRVVRQSSVQDTHTVEFVGYLVALG